jgi:hypothetical protein
MDNIEHSTSSIQYSMVGCSRVVGKWLLAVRCWLVVFFFCFSLTTTLLLYAQTPLQIPPAAQAQLQVQQPPVDVSPAETIAVTAEFDPPVVHPGEKSFYRVTVDAGESAIRWPEKISAPAELNLTAVTHGEISRMSGSRFTPLTTFLYEAGPATAGDFTVTNFSVKVAGQAVEIPATSLKVSTGATNGLPARRLMLEASATNLFLGQPFRLRVLLPAGNGNEIEALREIQLNGNGLMTDRRSQHLSVAVTSVQGTLKPTFICEMTVTPIAAGPMKLSAQAFTAGREFSGPISITGQVTIPGGPPKYVLVVSSPLAINVRPLPAGEPAGFTGTLGKFSTDQPQLATNRLRVGEPVRLKINFQGAGELARFVSPQPPRTRGWQVIADQPPATGFTLIPQTDTVTNTPAIPFCAFDPATGKYYDLTIPALPVTVIGDGLPTVLPALTDENQSAAPPKLSGLAASVGKTSSSLKPLQLRGWFVCVQLVPVIGFLALWQWDRRRRFWEAHPDLFRRRAARRALRRKKREWQNAIAGGDAAGFVRNGVDALRIAVAPHFPAEPRALVCADVLAQLGDAGCNDHAGETVRKVFAAADAQFAITPQTQTDLLALAAEVEAVLQKLEEKL